MESRRSRRPPDRLVASRRRAAPTAPARKSRWHRIDPATGGAARPRGRGCAGVRSRPCSNRHGPRGRCRGRRGWRSPRPRQAGASGPSWPACHTSPRGRAGRAKGWHSPTPACPAARAAARQDMRGTGGPRRSRATTHHRPVAPTRQEAPIVRRSPARTGTQQCLPPAARSRDDCPTAQRRTRAAAPVAARPEEPGRSRSAPAPPARHQIAPPKARPHRSRSQPKARRQSAKAV